MPSIAAWIRPIYLYVVCLVALITFIVGATTIGNELMRRYIFGLKTRWYENPKISCEYILTQEKLPPEHYDRETVYREDYRPTPAKPVPVSSDSEEPTDEERQERYERCITNRTEDIKMRAKFDLADRMSDGLTAIIIAVPLFWWHWRIAKRERAKS